MRISHLRLSFLKVKKASACKAKSEQISSNKIILRGFVLVSHRCQWISVLNFPSGSLKKLSSVSERFFSIQECMTVLLFCRTVIYSAKERYFPKKKKPQTIIPQVLIQGVVKEILFLCLPW